MFKEAISLLGGVGCDKVITFTSMSSLDDGEMIANDQISISVDNIVIGSFSRSEIQAVLDRFQKTKIRSWFGTMSGAKS